MQPASVTSSGVQGVGTRVVGGVGYWVPGGGVGTGYWVPGPGTGLTGPGTLGQY